MSAARPPQWLFALAVAAAACDPGPAATEGGTETPGNQQPSPVPCAEGFQADPSGAGCTDISPPSDCPPGTRPALGSTVCQPVGSVDCAEGFAHDASGWGCRDISPAELCAGPTLERLGSTRCEPIGDCQRPFPPAGAGYFVDDSYTAAQIDATHFQSIGAALTAAPVGAIVAVEAGTYREALRFRRAATVAGRCAELVLVESLGGPEAGAQATGVTGVRLQGLTLKGHRGGVVVASGGAMEVEDCLVVGNREIGLVASGGSMRVVGSRVSDTQLDAADVFGFGAFVQNGGEVVLDRSAVTGNRINGIAVIGERSRATLQSSIVRGTRPGRSGKFGKGAVAREAGELVVRASALVDNASAHLAVHDSGTRATVSGSVLRDAVSDLFGNHGNGIEISTSAQVFVEAATLRGNGHWGVLALDPGSALTMKASTVSGEASRPGGARGLGIAVSGGARADAFDSAVVRTVNGGLRAQDEGSHLRVERSVVHDTLRGPDNLSGDGTGVVAVSGAAFEMVDSAVLASTGSGAGLSGTGSTGLGSRGRLLRSLVADVRPTDGRYGLGIQVLDGSSLEMTHSAVARNHELGLGLSGAGSSARVEGSVIRDTRLEPTGRFGYGVSVDRQATLRIRGTLVRGSAGVGMVFAGGAGTIDAVAVADNEVGIHLQDGSVLRQVSLIAEALLPLDVQVNEETRFVDNRTRLGSGVLPLPDLRR